jgi:hypothetical protein
VSADRCGVADGGMKSLRHWLERKIAKSKKPQGRHEPTLGRMFVMSLRQAEFSLAATSSHRLASCFLAASLLLAGFLLRGAFLFSH